MKKRLPSIWLLMVMLASCGTAAPSGTESEIETFIETIQE